MLECRAYLNAMQWLSLAILCPFIALLFTIVPLNGRELVHSESNYWRQFGLDESKNTEILIQYTSYNKKGPEYSLHIDGNGIVEYTGTKNVKTMGNHSSKISTEDLNRIIQGFKETYFFYLKDSYGSSKELSSQGDQVSVSLKLGDRYKVVKYTQDSPVSISLKVLVQEIEKITSSNKLSGIEK